MRQALGALLVAAFLVFIGIPFGAFGLVHVKREEWWMKVRRLLGGFFVAVFVAVVLSRVLGAASAPAALASTRTVPLVGGLVGAPQFYQECTWTSWPFCGW